MGTRFAAIFSAVVFSLLVSCGNGRSTAIMPGSVVLQLHDMRTPNADGAGGTAFWRVTSPAPGTLLAQKIIEPPFSPALGRILEVSSDGRYAVRETPSAKSQSDVRSGNGRFELVDLENGATAAITFDDPGETRGMMSQRFEFLFSPDSTKLAYSDCREALLLDCAKGTRSTLRRIRTGRYWDSEVYAAFAGNLRWVGPDAVYMQFRESMPYAFKPGTPDDPREPDRAAIVDLSGRAIKSGSPGGLFGRLNAYGATGFPSLVTFMDKPFWGACSAFSFDVEDDTVFLMPSSGTAILRTDLANFLNSAISPKPLADKTLDERMENWRPAPDGRHAVALEARDGKPAWHWEDLDSGTRTALRAEFTGNGTLGALYFLKERAFLCSVNMTKNGDTVSTLFHVIPLSGEKALTVAIDNMGLAEGAVVVGKR